VRYLYLCRLACCVGLSLALFHPAPVAARIEAIKGKQYRLTKQHGPWMIMVASLHSRAGKQPTAAEAADDLVYELRRKGIPAYTYNQRQAVDTIDTVDRHGRQRQRVYTAQQDRVCVIAGNYPGVQDRIAQKTLEYIKIFSPKSWEQHGIYRKTPGRPGPLSGAFLTINPLLSPEEVAKRKQDSLLLRLNTGSEYSLLDNPGKFTLVVATFQGKSTTKIGNQNFQEAEQSFKIGNTLDEAAEDAQQLVRLLHSERLSQLVSSNILHLLNGRGFEAYLFHDRYRSIVSVGSFESPRDPRIAELTRLFGAKVRQNRETGQNVLTGEIIAIPGKKPGDPPAKTFLFDPYPRLMPVPKLR